MAWSPIPEPGTTPQWEPGFGASSAAPPGPSAGPPSGDAIAADGKRWAGQGYVFGGTGAHPGDWDCSSFASYVLGHDLGLALPGGTWAQVTASGTQHGPVVLTFATWGGAFGIADASAAPGDLVLWPGIGADGHMGIVTGTNQMVSALNSAQGTLVSPIDGFGPAGIIPVFRRLSGIPAGAPVPGGGTMPGVVQTTAANWGSLVVGLLAGLGIGVGAIMLALGAAAAAGLGIAWLVHRAAREVL